jgi:VanZ family protein
MSRKAALTLWGPVLLYGGLIFLLSSMSLDFIGRGPFPHWDKVAHLSEFGLFCFLIFRAIRGTFPRARVLSIALWALLITIAYGSLDEFHQAFTPHRDADPFDALADSVGGLLVVMTWLLWDRKKVR